MAQKLLIYQAISSELVSALRADGFDVYYIAPDDSEQSRQELIEKANGEGYMLLTGKEEIAEHYSKQQPLQAGIILYTGSQQLSGLQSLIKALHQTGDALKYQYSVISDKGLQRQRNLNQA